MGGLTEVPGISVGHYSDYAGATGCTVVLCPEGAVGGVDVRGGAPGTRETELLGPTRLVEQVQAILLTGGSAFGLSAADGVMHYLEERGYGHPVGDMVVPIVPAAVLFDLGLGEAQARPNAEVGYASCLAGTQGEIAEGSVGVGTGATVGKLLGMEWAMKGGLGTTSERLGEGRIVAALVAVNALGDIVDPESRVILAGARSPQTGGFLDTLAALKARPSVAPPPNNTTLGVVATNIPLSVTEANTVAQMAHNGLALSIRPAHTRFDGDTIFALSLPGPGIEPLEVSLVGAVAAELVAQAVVRAVQLAVGLHGVPAARDIVREE